MTHWFLNEKNWTLKNSKVHVVDIMTKDMHFEYGKEICTFKELQ